MSRAPLALLVSSAALALASCADRPQDGEPAGGRTSAGAALATSLVASEELILELTPRLKSIPPAEWPLPDSPRDAGTEFLHRGLGVLSGKRDGDEFLTEVTFSALAKDGSGHVAIAGEATARWAQAGGGWAIAAWEEATSNVSRRRSLMFEEVLDGALPDPQQRAAARTSLHNKILVENYFGGKPAQLPPGYSDTRFFPDSVNIHPALSVADVDADGHDDIYVCVRWGKNLLLRNRGDGTFEECAARFGIDIEGRNTVALFADFDNDGDLDLVLGRSLERSLYLINNGGRFTPHPSPVAGGELPFLVTSASAADVDRDGLLDVYLCTYSPLDINTRIRGGGGTGATPGWAKRFLPAEQAAEVARRNAGAHSYLGQVGPPNLLLLGTGDGFRVAPASESVAGYRNSFQATWADYDRDGDPDLYLANDFAPDALYRNDGADGLTEISAGAGIDTMGFAMGAAWGDYDGDGFEDLYVSNMYSKAGRRITSQVPDLDARFAASAAGNFLYRNRGDGTLERVSGADGKPVPVHLAGWSWGGQFCDFDNDTHLDLYVSSGFYTPPPGEDNGVDL